MPSLFIYLIIHTAPHILSIIKYDNHRLVFFQLDVRVIRAFPLVHTLSSLVDLIDLLFQEISVQIQIIVWHNISSIPLLGGWRRWLLNEIVLEASPLYTGHVWGVHLTYVILHPLIPYVNTIIWIQSVHSPLIRYPLMLIELRIIYIIPIHWSKVH
jgi:hypothetical protein